MASPHSLPFTAYMLLFFLTCLPPTTLSQDPSSSTSLPTIADCGPHLLPLAACAPFVQGSAESPAQPCCDNLKQLYGQQPLCLCLLLNDTSISSFPINSTLALRLPDLCKLQVDISRFSTCSGIPVPPSSPRSQVSLGANNSSSAAASPMVQVAPRPTIMGFGFGRSASMRLKLDSGLPTVVAAATTAYLLTKLLDWI